MFVIPEAILSAIVTREKDDRVVLQVQFFQKVENLADGGKGIASVRNFQVVNGGQTTASLHRAMRKDKADLSQIFVPMKLSVVTPDMVEEIVPKISLYANTQNRASGSRRNSRKRHRVSCSRGTPRRLLIAEMPPCKREKHVFESSVMRYEFTEFGSAFREQFHQGGYRLVYSGHSQNGPTIV